MIGSARKVVACAISGGVDSAVSTYLLKKCGHRVIGVFMINWDKQDEGSDCSLDADLEDAQFVAKHLQIPLFTVNFVKPYWTQVFQNTLEAYSSGFTPNPDILCNRFIKFDLFARHCLNELGADLFATGHYAQLEPSNLAPPIATGQRPIGLHRARDHVKDQTFWLSGVRPDLIFSKCAFPIGHLLKSEVKRIARDIGLQKIARRRESMGMCFIGKRKFSDFIDQYLPSKPGRFVLLEQPDRVLGEHRGIHHFTIGQKAPVSLDTRPLYVAQLDEASQTIFLVSGNDHPALFHRECHVDAPHWFYDYPIRRELFEGRRKIRFVWQNKWRSVAMRMTPISSQTANETRSGSERGSSPTTNQRYRIELDEWMRCIAPGQIACFYDESDSECLGSARIHHAVSAYEQGVQHKMSWSQNDWLLQHDSIPTDSHNSHSPTSQQSSHCHAIV